LGKEDFLPGEEDFLLGNSGGFLAPRKTRNKFILKKAIFPFVDGNF